MKKVMLTVAGLLIATQTALGAADLTKCNGQYLMSVGPENMNYVNTLVLRFIADGRLELKTFNPQLDRNMKTVYGVEVRNSAPENQASVLQLMTHFRQLSGAIIECNSSLSLGLN